MFTLPIPPVEPTYTEAFSRKVLPEQYINNIIDYNFVERRKLYVRTVVMVNHTYCVTVDKNTRQKCRGL